MKFFFTLIFLLFTFILYEGLKKDPSNIPSNLISKEIPEFSIKTFSNSYLSDFELKNDNVAIINFFASWCPPCRVEHEQLLKLSGDIPIYGIAKKNKKQDLSKWLEELGNPYKKIGMDETGLLSIEWGVYGIPETFIVDNGLVKYRHVGPIMLRDLETIKKIANNLQ